jgi:hypothetical protein
VALTWIKNWSTMASISQCREAETHQPKWTLI